MSGTTQAEAGGAGGVDCGVRLAGSFYSPVRSLVGYGLVERTLIHCMVLRGCTATSAHSTLPVSLTPDPAGIGRRAQ